MRIIYTTWSGRRVVRQFEDWRSMCVWLKRYYPFIQVAREFGEFADSF